MSYFNYIILKGTYCKTNTYGNIHNMLTWMDTEGHKHDFILPPGLVILFVLFYVFGLWIKNHGICLCGGIWWVISFIIEDIYMVTMEFQVVFHGIKVNQEELLLDGSEAPVRIDAETLLVSEELAPVAILNKVIFSKLEYIFICASSFYWDANEFNLFRLIIQHMQIRVPYRPIDSKICALSADRDKLPSGKQILALTLTWVLDLLCCLSEDHLDSLFSVFWYCSYKVKLEDGAQVKPHIPLLNDRIYDTKFESQFYMISDSNKVYVKI